MKYLHFLLPLFLFGNLLYGIELQETRLYSGVSKYSQNQEDKTNTIILGKEQDEEAFTLGLTQYLSFESLPLKQTRFYGDYSYTANTDKSLHQFFVGSEVSLYPFSRDKVFYPYAGIGLGYSYLIWNSEPISTIDNKDTTSGSLALEMHMGLLYYAFKHALLDLTLRHIRYHHEADIRIGQAESELIDDSQTGIFLGVRF